MPSVWLENAIDGKSRLKLAGDQALVLGDYSGLSKQKGLVSV